jgi:hypothetical protein
MTFSPVRESGAAQDRVLTLILEAYAEYAARAMNSEIGRGASVAGARSLLQGVVIALYGTDWRWQNAH